MNPFSDIVVPTLGDVIAGHATLRPDAIALRFGASEWRYVELDAYANRIAHSLVATVSAPAIGSRISGATATSSHFLRWHSHVQA